VAASTTVDGRMREGARGAVHIKRKADHDELSKDWEMHVRGAHPI